MAEDAVFIFSFWWKVVEGGLIFLDLVEFPDVS